MVYIYCVSSADTLILLDLWSIAALHHIHRQHGVIEKSGSKFFARSMFFSSSSTLR
jgi:hypothetical protein